MNIIYLNNLELKVFTEQDVSDYCQLNNINPDNITELYLSDNKLTDISGIQYLKNLKILILYDNKLENISFLKDLKQLNILNLSNTEIKDISVIQYLNKLEILRIDNLELESDQIKYIKSLKNLKELWCEKSFKDMSVLNKLYNVRIIK